MWKEKIKSGIQFDENDANSYANSRKGVRSETDWCKTYIIDDHWAWFSSKKAGQFAPEWFRDAWRKETTIR